MSYDPANVSPPLGVELLGDDVYSEFCDWFVENFGIEWDIAWDNISMCVDNGMDPLSVTQGDRQIPPPGLAASAWSKVWGWLVFASQCIGGGVPVVVPPIPIRAS